MQLDGRNGAGSVDWWLLLSIDRAGSWRWGAACGAAYKSQSADDAVLALLLGLCAGLGKVKFGSWLRGCLRTGAHLVRIITLFGTCTSSFFFLNQEENLSFF